jgi:Ni,Fe-hydrogenase I small subunit
MFRFTSKPSSGSHSQYLAKITHLVQCGYIEVIQILSVLWLHSMACEACVHSTHASQVIHIIHRGRTNVVSVMAAEYDL